MPRRPPQNIVAHLARLQLAQKRLLNILRSHDIAIDRTLEQKISDAGPANQRVDPHILTQAKALLVGEGRIVRLERDGVPWYHLPELGVFPLLKSLLPVVVAFLLPTTDTLDHRRVGNGTHRHGLFQEPMEELPAMA